VEAEARCFMRPEVESMYFYTNTALVFVFPRYTVHASVDLISGVETLHAPRCSTSVMCVPHVSLKDGNLDERKIIVSWECEHDRTTPRGSWVGGG
jgi:hypothetical protein